MKKVFKIIGFGVCFSLILFAIVLTINKLWFIPNHNWIEGKNITIERQCDVCYSSMDSSNIAFISHEDSCSKMMLKYVDFLFGSSHTREQIDSAKNASINYVHTH